MDNYRWSNFGTRPYLHSKIIRTLFAYTLTRHPIFSHKLAFSGFAVSKYGGINTQPYFPAMWYCVAHIDPSLYFIDHTNQNALGSLLWDATVYTVIQLKPS